MPRVCVVQGGSVAVKWFLTDYWDRHGVLRAGPDIRAGSRTEAEDKARLQSGFKGLRVVGELVWRSDRNAWERVVLALSQPKEGV